MASGRPFSGRELAVREGVEDERDTPTPPPEETYEQLVATGDWGPKRAASFITEHWATRQQQAELVAASLAGVSDALKPALEPEAAEGGERSSSGSDRFGLWARYSTQVGLYFYGDHLSAAYIVLLSLLHTAALLGMGMSFSMILDRVSTPTAEGRPGEMPSNLVGALLVCGILCSVAVAGKSFLTDMASSRFLSRLRETVMRSLLMKPTAWLQNNPAAAAAAGATEAAGAMVYRPHVVALWDVGQLLCGALGMAAGSPAVMGVVLLLSSTLAAAALLFRRHLAPKLAAADTHRHARDALGAELMQLVGPIRLYAAEQHELQCFLGASARGQAAYETLAMWHAGYLGVGVLALCACLCFALALFASAVRSMQASVGGLMTALLFAAYTLVYVQHLFEQVTLLWQGLELTQPLWEVLNMAALHDSLADILEDDERRTLPTPLGELVLMAEDVVPYDRNKGAMPLFNVERRGHVRFDSVRLTYPSRPGYRVLKDFTMEIPAEKTLGLMGHAGSGKTSLAALLLRQMRPTHGMVTIDSVDVHDFNAQYNTMVFYLGPEPLIFEGTVRDNIGYGRGDRTTGHNELTQREIEHAARLADLHRFVTYLPSQYDTVLGGDAGMTLPTAAAARLMLARAYAMSAAIIVADNFVPAADEPQNRRLRTLLYRLTKFPTDQTALIVSNNPEDLRQCDLLACVHDGVLCEYGVTTSLVANPDSFFHQLASMRSAGGARGLFPKPPRTGSSRGGRPVTGSRSRPSSRARTPGSKDDRQVEIAEPVYELTTAASIFKHPVAAGKHNQVHPQPRGPPSRPGTAGSLPGSRPGSANLLL